MLATKNSIEHVVKDGLCHRCGACAAICPIPDCISWDSSSYPQINASTCIECSLCERVCSGDTLDIESLKKALPQQAPAPASSPLGGFHRPWVCRARDASMRGGGASGGTVTQLLIHLLELGEIDGAIVAGMDPDEPWRVAPMVATSVEEIREAAGSKYTAAPLVQAMHSLLRTGREANSKRYAFVGVACHVHGLRMLTNTMRRARLRIRCVIGPLCKSAFDPEAATDLLRANGLRTEDVKRLEYRGGTWPGVMRAQTRDGCAHALHQSNFRDGAYNYLMSLYTQPRCHLCYDFGNELADLTVGDPWSWEKSGRYTHEGGHTLVLPRTETGKWLVDLMHESPEFTVEPAPDEAVEFHQRAAKAKQRLVQFRMGALSKRGRPVPQYDRRLPELDRMGSLKARLFSLTLHVGRLPTLRYWVLKVLVSRPAMFLVYLRQWRKFGVRGTRYVNRLTARTHRP